MPKLILKFRNQVIKEYPLKKDKAITVGRRPNNDVVIENLAVSGNHAKIDPINDGYILTDLQSKNGTFVNEQLITSHRLKHGDLVTIGKHSLEFAYEDGELRLDDVPSSGKMEQTMVMDTDKYRAMRSKGSTDDTKPSKGGESIGILSYLSGGDGEIDITKKIIKIGKDSTCDIIVKGMFVGKISFTISKRPNGYYLSYVGGLSKPKINGETIKESVMLNEFDVIEIGAAKLQFVIK
ncbi:MAG: FHA domain-containing protein [Desulfobacterales bacterium]|nr:FHA domain-containing protein [Desulfobacterales bacterium]